MNRQTNTYVPLENHLILVLYYGPSYKNPDLPNMKNNLYMNINYQYLPDQDRTCVLVVNRNQQTINFAEYDNLKSI